MSLLVCIYKCTCALEKNIPGSFSLYFHIMLLLRRSEEGSPVCTNRRPCGKLLCRRDMLKECSHNIRKALFFLSAFQLHSWWDRFSLLVRLINCEENKQNEKWLHLTVKLHPLTIKVGLAIRGFQQRHREQKPGIQNIFVPQGQWHIQIAIRKYNYLRESTSTHERQ